MSCGYKTFTSNFLVLRHPEIQDMRILSEYSSYSTQAHDDVLAQWEAVQGEGGPLELDLTPVSFMDPYGMGRFETCFSQPNHRHLARLYRER